MRNVLGCLLTIILGVWAVSLIAEILSALFSNILWIIIIGGLVAVIIASIQGNQKDKPKVATRTKQRSVTSYERRTSVNSPNDTVYEKEPPVLQVLLIKKHVWGNRKWLQNCKASLTNNYEVGNLFVINHEVYAITGLRPVGAMVIINNTIFKANKAHIEAQTIERSSERRAQHPPTFWKDIPQEIKRNCHRTHAIPFRYSLDEGETRGITFVGSAYLDNGELSDSSYGFEDSNDPKHDTLVNYLADILISHCKQLRNQKQLEGETVLNATYPCYSFEALVEGDVNADTVCFNGERGTLMQFSMMHFERLSERIIRYFKEDDFVYSCELKYNNSEDSWVSDVELVLYNRTKNFTAFKVRLGNIIV